MREFDAGAENLGETVEVRLSRGRKFDAGVFDFFDCWENFADEG